MAEQALQSSQNERRAMEVEREVSDVYRCFAMIRAWARRFEGTVSAFVGSGCFVTLDEPFVDVLVRTEASARLPDRATASRRATPPAGTSSATA